MLDWIQVGEKGPWRIEHYEITKDQAAMYAIGCYGSYEIAPHAGHYTRLMHEKYGLVMSDTRQEIVMMYSVKSRSADVPPGIALINGLGLGIVSKWLLDDGWDVSVIEISQDLIDLIGVQLTEIYHERFHTICADALEWRPPKGSHYNIVFHDIWNETNLDNWEQYKMLHRRYGRLTDWQDSWGRDSLLRIKRAERHNYWR
jgi:hypothetical protein